MPDRASPIVESNLRKDVAHRLRIKSFAMTLLWVVMCFAGAGRLTWIRGWIGATVHLSASGVLNVIVSHLNPGLLGQREIWLRNDTRTFDRVVLMIYVGLGFIEVFIAGVDAGRFHWLALPGWTIVPGVVLFIMGMAMVGWAMVTSPFAETTLRLQTDRGQTVVESGPYRLVRHPMYLGFLVLNPATGLMLGSGWAMIVSVSTTAMIVLRTAYEDRFLRDRLPGYAGFAKRTRFRLVPLVW